MAVIEPFSRGSTTGFLHIPDQVLNRGVVLTHGAGANCQSPLLVAVATAFAASGFYVLRCDLAFRQRRRSGPPAPAQAPADRNSLLDAVTLLRGLVTGPLLLGGHSYGGRQASILATENASVANALILLSYPLHPPNKPTQLRTAHFPALSNPCLFVHGTKDPFGSIAEMTAALAQIPARTDLKVVENAGHDLRRGKFDISSLVVRNALEFLT